MVTARAFEAISPHSSPPPPPQNVCAFSSPLPSSVSCEEELFWPHPCVYLHSSHTRNTRSVRHQCSWGLNTACSARSVYAVWEGFTKASLLFCASHTEHFSTVGALIYKSAGQFNLWKKHRGGILGRPLHYMLEDQITVLPRMNSCDVRWLPFSIFRGLPFLSCCDFSPDKHP